MSGRFAETKVRGRLLEKEAKEKAEKEKKEVPEEVKEKFKTWNRGVAQVHLMALHLTPFITPCTLHPAPCTLHPTPCTPHPAAGESGL